jgi:hypothetical protein
MFLPQVEDDYDYDSEEDMSPLDDESEEDMSPFGGGGQYIPDYSQITKQELEEICEDFGFQKGTKKQMFTNICHFYNLDVLQQNCYMKDLRVGRTKKQCIENLIKHLRR